MSKGRFVVKKVKATTTNKQKAIINHLLSEGHSASRINTTGIYKKELDAWIQGGSRKGHSDISGVFKTSQFAFGIPFYIEGKFTKADELSVEQIEFRDEVVNAGALYLECENLIDFYEWYDKIKKLYL